MFAGPSTLPKSALKKRNGFIDPGIARVQGQISVPNLHGEVTAESITDPSKRPYRDAVERRTITEDIFEARGTYFPGVAAAKQVVDTPETSTAVKDEVDDLKHIREQELRVLFASQAEDHWNEAIDLYQSRYDPPSRERDDVVLEKSLDNLCAFAKAEYSNVRSYDEPLSDMRYAQLTTMTATHAHITALVAQEEEERRRRDMQFPANLAKYREIRNKDVQARVARFLTADVATKERMLSEFYWAWRQVENLMQEYETNDVFKAEIQEIARALEARDPRRKPPLGQP